MRGAMGLFCRVMNTIWPQPHPIWQPGRGITRSLVISMSKFVSLLAALLTAFAAAGAAAASLGPDAAACSSGRPSLLVSVNGFKARSGLLRVQLYGDNPDTFLAKGAKLKRIELRVPGGPMNVWVAVPHPGVYAVAVRHDVNGDKGHADWSDGGGF